MNSSLITGTFGTTEDVLGGDDMHGDHLALQIVFTPILLIQILITVASNSILLVMISRSIRSCTSLNIFLLSISVFNLLTVINQVTLLVYNLRKMTEFPHRLCHLVSIIRSSSTMGTTLLHLFISHHRLKIALKPLTWQNTRKQAWLLGTIIWAIAGAAALFECVLQFSHKDNMPRNLQTCYFPGVNNCTAMVSLYIQVLTMVCLGIVSGLTYYFYIKTAKELKDNELEKECRLRSSTLVKHRKRKLTAPERAVISLCTIFTIHCITQLPMYIYTIIVHCMALSNHDGGRRVNKGNEHDTGAWNSSDTISSTPILLLLSTISFITTGSPLILACINKKFKQHIMSIIQFICNFEEAAQQNFHNQLIAKFPIEEPPPDPEASVHSATLRDLEIFYASSSTDRSKLYLKESKKKKPKNSTSGHRTHLQVPDTSQVHRLSATPDASSSAMPLEKSPRVSRVSTTSASVGIAAVNAGLVLSAPGHRIMVNNFFIPNANEAILNELAALNFV